MIQGGCKDGGGAVEVKRAAARCGIACRKEPLRLFFGKTKEAVAEAGGEQHCCKRDFAPVVDCGNIRKGKGPASGGGLALGGNSREHVIGSQKYSESAQSRSRAESDLILNCRCLKAPQWSEHPPSRRWSPHPDDQVCSLEQPISPRERGPAKKDHALRIDRLRCCGTEGGLSIYRIARPSNPGDSLCRKEVDARQAISELPDKRHLAPIIERWRRSTTERIPFWRELRRASY